MRQFSFLILFLTVSMSCSSGDENADGLTNMHVEIPEHLKDVENLSIVPADVQPLYDIELIREATYGNKYDDDVFLGTINTFDVDDEGKVYLADMSNNQIHAYNPDGSYLRTIGRSGRGPGEFLTTYSGLDISVSENFLVVYDETNFRVSRFSLDSHEMEGMVLLNPGNWANIVENIGARPFKIFARNDSSYYAQFRTLPEALDSSEPRTFIYTSDMDLYDVYYTFNQNLESTSSRLFESKLRRSFVTEINGSLSAFKFPFMEQHLYAHSETGNFYTASSDQFLIKVHDSLGRVDRSIYSPHSVVPLTDDDRQYYIEERDSYRIAFREYDLPEQWPAINLMIADDENRLWVATVTEDRDSFEWWVLDEHDELLAKFQWPGNRMEKRGGEDYENFIIKNGALYYFYSESMDLDAQTVIKYRIEMSPR